MLQVRDGGCAAGDGVLDAGGGRPHPAVPRQPEPRERVPRPAQPPRDRRHRLRLRGGGGPRRGRSHHLPSEDRKEEERSQV